MRKLHFGGVCMHVDNGSKDPTGLSGNYLIHLRIRSLGRMEVDTTSLKIQMTRKTNYTVIPEHKSRVEIILLIAKKQINVTRPRS